MPEKRVRYKDILKRLQNRALTERDYEVLAAELAKVVRATEKGSPAPGGRRVVAQLPFGMDIVK